MTALMYAVCEGHRDIVELLLHSSVEVDRRGEHNNTRINVCG